MSILIFIPGKIKTLQLSGKRALHRYVFEQDFAFGNSTPFPRTPSWHTIFNSSIFQPKLCSFKLSNTSKLQSFSDFYMRFPRMCFGLMKTTESQ